MRPLAAVLFLFMAGTASAQENIERHHHGVSSSGEVTKADKPDKPAKDSNSVTERTAPVASAPILQIPAHSSEDHRNHHGDHGSKPRDEQMPNDPNLKPEIWQGLLRLGYTADKWQALPPNKKEEVLSHFMHQRHKAIQMAQYLIQKDGNAKCDEIGYLRTYLGDDVILPILLKHEQSQAHLSHQEKTPLPLKPNETSMARLIKDIADCRIAWDSPAKPNEPEPFLPVPIDGPGSHHGGHGSGGNHGSGHGGSGHEGHDGAHSKEGSYANPESHDSHTGGPQGGSSHDASFDGYVKQPSHPS